MSNLSPTISFLGLTVHWYGVIIAAGMALAVALAMAREKRLGLPRDTAVDLALVGIPSAIVCARLYYVAFSWQAYAEWILDVPAIVAPGECSEHCCHVDAEAARGMISGDCPLVFLSLNLQGEHASGILFESRKQGEMAADYLYGLGLRKMMHIFGLSGNYDSEMRCEGFLEGLEKHGIARKDVGMLEGKFERAAAYREMRKYLREGNPLPDAIFAANDLSALGCISAITEMGYSIPEDVSVMGCDDISLCLLNMITCSLE